MFEPERRSRYDVFLVSRSSACPAFGLVGISGTLLFSNSISVGFGSVVFPVVSKPLDPRRLPHVLLLGLHLTRLPIASRCHSRCRATLKSCRSTPSRRSSCQSRRTRRCTRPPNGLRCTRPSCQNYFRRVFQISAISGPLPCSHCRCRLPNPVT